MRVLIACEFSGIVRDAFRARGHDAWSCDLLPTEAPGPHYDCDVRDVRLSAFDMLIAFPPCTHLAVSGARWFPAKRANGSQQAAIDFFLTLANAPVARIAIENPVGIMSTLYRKPDQIIQPWQFGHGETKATCLWLKGLPKLQPTDIVTGRTPRVHHASPGPDRWKERSRTLLGIADAMAEQWGKTPCGPCAATHAREPGKLKPGTSDTMNYIPGKGYFEASGAYVGSKRKIDLALARVYGAEGNREAFTRLVIESKVRIGLLNEAFNNGRNAR